MDPDPQAVGHHFVRVLERRRDEELATGHVRLLGDVASEEEPGIDPALGKVSLEMASDSFLAERDREPEP